MSLPHRFDCPECLAKDAVLCFIGLPEIWRCDLCHFWFEQWELLRNAQTNRVSRCPLSLHPRQGIEQTEQDAKI
jgi:rubredoxin